MGGDTKQDRAARVAPELMAVLKEVRQAVVRKIGDDFEMILFGSQARGEAGPDSDVDLMVILPDERATLQTKNQVRDVVYDFSLCTSYLFTVIVVSRSLVRERAGFLVFGAVEREGVVV